jgi:predicted O-methyltransferase YrrM
MSNVKIGRGGGQDVGKSSLLQKLGKTYQRAVSGLPFQRLDLSEKTLLGLGALLAIVSLLALIRIVVIEWAIQVSTLLCFLSIVLIAQSWKKRNVRSMNNLFAQMEALHSLTDVLQPIAFLPASRGWAGSPDFLREIALSIFREKPQLVLEASSGCSTLVIGYCLKKLGNGGKVISFEHDEKYAKISQEYVALHGLDDYVTVVHAKLVSHQIGGKEWQWYDFASSLTGFGKAQMLVIDGPPTRVQTTARYPAVPLLFPYLQSGAVILLDDSMRKPEQRAVKMWREQYDFMSVDYLPLEKGCFSLRLNK